MTWTFGRWQRKIWEIFPRAVINSEFNEYGTLWATAVDDGQLIDVWRPNEDRGPNWYNGLDRPPHSKALSSQPQKGLSE